jgi:hypothetical protein
MAHGRKGIFGKIITPEEFAEKRRNEGNDGENFAILRAFSALAPLAESPKEYYSLMLAIEDRPVLAAAAAIGDRGSITALKQTLNNSKARNLPENEAFAAFFQFFSGGRAYTKETEFMGMGALELTGQCEPLMKLNEPIPGAYRYLSTLKNSATIYFSTQGSPEFAEMVCFAWEIWIKISFALKSPFQEMHKNGILDAQINGPFPINIPTDLSLLLTEDGDAKLFSNNQTERIVSSVDGDKAKHMRLVAEREKLPYENIWLLEGSYNRQVFAALRESGFRNIAVVENNPGLLKWNYEEARRDGVPVLKMDDSPADTGRLLTK